MRTYIVWSGLLVAILMSPGMTPHAGFAAAPENEERAWKIYTNARFGFSVRYPESWRLGNPISDGVGVTLYPPIDNSLVALSGHMNVLEGKSQDGRQTLDEFAIAHRRIITELFAKKTITVKWREDKEMSLAGFPAKQLTFTYSDDNAGRHDRTPHLYTRPQRGSRDTNQNASLGRRPSDAGDHENVGDLSAGTRSERGQPSGAEAGLSTDDTALGDSV